MKERIRRDNALRAAEQYAPAPKNSRFTYGIVGLILAGVGLYFFATFYGIDLSRQPAIVIGVMALPIIDLRIDQRAHSHCQEVPLPARKRLCAP